MSLTHPWTVDRNDVIAPSDETGAVEVFATYEEAERNLAARQAARRANAALTALLESYRFDLTALGVEADQD